MYIYYINILTIDLSPKRIFLQPFNELKGHAYGIKKEEKVGSNSTNIDTMLLKKKNKISNEVKNLFCIPGLT